MFGCCAKTFPESGLLLPAVPLLTRASLTCPLVGVAKLTLDGLFVGVPVAARRNTQAKVRHLKAFHLWKGYVDIDGFNCVNAFDQITNTLTCKTIT